MLLDWYMVPLKLLRGRRSQPVFRYCPRGNGSELRSNCPMFTYSLMIRFSDHGIASASQEIWHDDTSLLGGSKKPLDPNLNPYDLDIALTGESTFSTGEVGNINPPTTNSSVPLTIPPTAEFINSECFSRLASNPVEFIDYDHVFDFFSIAFTQAVARHIVEFMKNYASQTIDPVSKFGVSVLRSLTTEYNDWAMLEWREGEVEAMTLIHVGDSENFSCDRITHYGLGKHSTSTGKDWKQGAISWSFGEMSSLESLVVAVHHVLRISRMPFSDCLEQYWDQTSRGE